MYRTNKIKNIETYNSGFVSVAELFIRSAQNGSSIKEFHVHFLLGKLVNLKYIVSSVIDHLKFMLKIIVKMIALTNTPNLIVFHIFTFIIFYGLILYGREQYYFSINH